MNVLIINIKHDQRWQKWNVSKNKKEAKNAICLFTVCCCWNHHSFSFTELSLEPSSIKVFISCLFLLGFLKKIYTKKIYFPCFEHPYVVVTIENKKKTLCMGFSEKKLYQKRFTLLVLGTPMSL